MDNNYNANVNIENVIVNNSGTTIENNNENKKGGKGKTILIGAGIVALLAVIVASIIFGSRQNSVGDESVKITSDVKELEIGWGYQLEVSQTIDKNHHLEYESSDKDILYVNDKGYMNAIREGEATITVSVAENSKVKDSIKVKVVPENKDRIFLSEKTIYIKIGESRKIYVYNIAENGYVTWESEDPEVATVDDGLIKGVSLGATTVTVTNEKGSVQPVKVNVVDETPLIIELEEITIGEQDIGMDVGEKLKLTVTYNPREATDKSLTWESSNPDAIVVDEEGTLTAVGDGNSTIVATSTNGKKAMSNARSTTNIIPVTNIKLDKEKVKVYVGDTATLRYTITPNDATSKNVTWSSSNPAVATVDNKGYVIGIKEGTSTVMVRTSNGKTATATITVEKKVIEPVVVQLDRTNLTMNVGNTATLYANVRPSNATNKTLTWVSSDGSVASVKDGVITANRVGTTNITVKTFNGKSATCRVNVTTKVIEVESISLNKKNLDLKIRETDKLTVKFNPDEATNQNITWKSSDTSIVTVSNGTVRAIKAGKATITATSSNGKTATATVNVSKMDDTITISKKTTYYTGKVISATITARSHTTVKSTYYSDSECKNKTTTAQAETAGGAPHAAGTYYVIAESAGNDSYNPGKSKCSVAVIINKKTALITCRSVIYNGQNQTIATCTGGVIANASHSEVGDHTVYCNGTDNFGDAAPKKCNVRAFNISKAKIEGLENKHYSGSAIIQEPIVKVMLNNSEKTLVSGTDYTFTTTGNTSPGKATVVIVGKGNYTGTARANFNVLAEPAIITCNNKEYNGKAQTIASCIGGTVTNASQTAAGPYTVSCNPDRNHSAAETKSCQIMPKSISNVTVEGVEDKQFTQGGVKLNIKVKDGNTPLALDRDYTVSYSNNMHVGTASVTITGKRNYTGTISKTFNITKNQYVTAEITCLFNKYTGSMQAIASCKYGTVQGHNQKDVGRYTITCTGDNDHYDAPPKECPISQAPDIISLIGGSIFRQPYSGNEVPARLSVASGATPTITYYSDSRCTDSKAVAESPHAPTEAGRYWIVASTNPKNSPYTLGELSCTKAVCIYPDEATKDEYCNKN